jgi:hypothetical protein
MDLDHTAIEKKIIVNTINLLKMRGLMTKSSIFLSALLIIAFLSQSTVIQAQTTKRKPGIIIEVNAGYGLPLMDLKGDAEGFWNFSNYGTTTGYHGGFTVKLGVRSYKMAQLRPYFTLGYSQFSGDRDGRSHNPDGYIPAGWPNKGFKNQTTYVPVDTTGTSEVVLRMPYAALGFEIAQYTDKKNLSSFNFGLDLTMSFIFGRVNETHTYAIPGVAGAGEEVSYTMKSNVRFGLGLNVGYNYRVPKSPIGFNVGTRFSLINLIGKEVKEANQEGEFYLMDGSAPGVNSLLSSSRSISSLSFFGGVSFYIGSR